MKINVLFQGDSITDCGRGQCSGGAGYENGGLGPGYPMLIASRLFCSKPETEWHITNRGISGNRIVDLYARWRCDCINLEPDILTILIGVNDTWHEDHQNGVDVPRYERFYRELVTWTREKLPNVKIVLMEPFLCPHREPIIGMVAEVDQRRAVVRKIANEMNTIFIPLQDIFNEAFKHAPMNHWSADGVHPTPAGHQLIADAWLKALGY